MFKNKEPRALHQTRIALHKEILKKNEKNDRGYKKPMVSFVIEIAWNWILQSLFTHTEQRAHALRYQLIENIICNGAVQRSKIIVR